MAETARSGSNAPASGSALQARGIKTYIERHREELLGMLADRQTSGLALARRHAKIMDGLLMTLYPAAFTDLRQPLTSSVCLAAVGGYGRQLLGWKSDLDVRLLTDEPPETIQPLAEALLYPLWDAGVSIGHQVVSIADAVSSAEDDLPTATALLDSRPLAGADGGAHEALRERARTQLFHPRGLRNFVRRLETEVEERHRRFSDSMYLLEPDVKNGEGGLRDLDVALWAARARFRVTELSELVESSVLVAREARELTEAADFVWAVRNHLHRRANRRSDRLGFMEQELVASSLGYRARIGAWPGASEAQLLAPMVESFMSDYYRHTRVIGRAREQIIARAMIQSVPRVRVEELGNGVVGLDGQIAMAAGADLTSDPALALRLFAAAVARGSRVMCETRDAIARAASDPAFCAALRADPEAAALFISLLCTVRKVQFRNGSILAELHDVGLLVALIPEFGPVVGRVHHDLYHVYPVDVHSIGAVDCLRAMLRGELLKDSPLACRLSGEITRPEVLFLATLLHDVGKAEYGHGHAARGAQLARGIFERLGFSPAEIEHGCWLVGHHLAMYFVATRRDLGELATLGEFARAVQDRAGLRDLYIMTVADLCTTAPTSMTDWKARMLDELFHATDALLTEPIDKPRADATRRALVRSEVMRIGHATLDTRFLTEYLDTMPERYLLSNSPPEIVAHAEVAAGTQTSPVRVQLVPSRHAGVAELCVVTMDQTGVQNAGAGLCVVAGDRPGLLAAITAAISASRLEICAAQIHSRTGLDGNAQAVDLFWVRDRADGAEGVERVLPKLERDLHNVITGSVAPNDLLGERPSRWAEKPSPPVTTDVHIDHASSARYTIIEIFTKDRPGLLFTVAHTLHELGLMIAVAKVNTEGNRVIDVFYVTEIAGGKIEPGPRSVSVRARLLAALRTAGN